MKIVSLAERPDEGVSHNPEITKRVLLGARDVPGLVYLSHARFAPGQATRAHAHRGMSEVFFVVSGEGRIEVDGRAQALAAGSCAAVAPGESHEITNTGAGELVLVYFGVVSASG